jgi:copper(I)-binding protein
VASTSNQKAVEAGTQADAGSIAIRGLLIEAPTGRTPYYDVGDDAPVRVVIVNSGPKADLLTGITSSAFTSWGAFRTTADGDAVAAAANPPSTLALAPSSAPASGSNASGSSAAATGTSTSGTAASSTPAAPSSAAAQLPTPSTSVTIPPGQRVSWGVPDAKGALLLMHLKQRVYPGSTVVLTFTFANAGSVTVRVPVALSSVPDFSVIPAPTSGGEG